MEVNLKSKDFPELTWFFPLDKLDNYLPPGNKVSLTVAEKVVNIPST